MRALVFLMMLATLGGCAVNPLDDITLPQLCRRTAVAREVGAMNELLYGKKLAMLIRHFGPPSRHERNAQERTETVVWGPLRIDYRRGNGTTGPMDCTVEMEADAAGAITRVFWDLRPPDPKPPLP